MAVTAQLHKVVGAATHQTNHMTFRPTAVHTHGMTTPAVGPRAKGLATKWPRSCISDQSCVNREFAYGYMKGSSAYQMKIFTV